MENNVCQKCQGTGWILEESGSGTVAKRCTCFVDRKSQIIFDQANIPLRYKNCTFENFEVHNNSHKDALKVSKKFFEDYPVLKCGLLFQGPCGVGKTHLAVAIINELIEKKRIECYFYDFRALIRDIQKSFDRESPLKESDLLGPVFQKDVLVLDELGAKRTSDWVDETIFYIINKRYNNKKLTIFTSNYIDSDEEEEDNKVGRFKDSEESLLTRIGVRLRSRIYEMCKIVNMWGKDYRRNVKQETYRF